MKKILLSILFLTNIAFSENCIYKFDLNNTIINGTGYKYTNKTAVTGKFSDLKLLFENRADSINELISKTKISINLNSINSGNEIRDNNLKNSLFKNLVNKAKVIIQVKDLYNKEIKSLITLNNITKEINFDYKLDNLKLSATSSINAKDFNLGKQIEWLIELCNKLHTGEDGISKTWTDFGLALKTEIIKTCN